MDSVDIKALFGASGEHYVMFELLRRGWIAALAPERAPHIDIVVSDTSGTSMFAVQVKTRTPRGGKGWPLNQKVENLRTPNLIYCFVILHPDLLAKPTTYVVPSSVVAEAVSRSHKAWLSAPGKRGPHKDSSVRYLGPDTGKLLRADGDPYPKDWMDRYLEAWDQFGPVVNIASAAEDP